VRYLDWEPEPPWKPPPRKPPPPSPSCEPHPVNPKAADTTETVSTIVPAARLSDFEVMYVRIISLPFHRSRFFPALLLVIYTATDVRGSASARDADRPYTGAI
jgi:hypothetical protein